MPVMDEFKEEREALKNGSLKDKLKYFWDYYKWHTIAVIIAIVVVISLLNTVLSRKETAFYGAFLNTVENSMNSEDYAKEFGTAMGIDTKKYDVVFDSTMYMDISSMDQATVATTQRMLVYIAAGDVDMIVTDANTLRHYSYNNTLVDLRTLLTPEQQKKYEPYYYYVDMKVVRDIQEASSNLDTTYVPQYPEDYFDPATMAEPVPVGICMDSCTTLKNNLRFRDKDTNIIFGVVVGGKHQDLALEYLEYTFEEPTK